MRRVRSSGKEAVFACWFLLSAAILTLHLVEQNAKFNRYMRTTLGWMDSSDAPEPNELVGVPSGGCRHASDDVCCLLPKYPTASSLWTRSLPDIVRASAASSSSGRLTEKMLRELLYGIVSPARLRKALRSQPTNDLTLGHIAAIVRDRIRSPDSSPPLKIAVLGGSVTIGRGCGKGMADYECAWPNRFQVLINSLVGKNIIKVENMGNGGTSTDQGALLIKYWMYPKELAEYGPDVIINSFSTNDSLPPGWWLKGDEKPDAINGVRDVSWDKNQAFIRAALQSRYCSVPPLVIHLDEYLGHQQDAVLGELQYNDVISRLSRWYGTMFVSYADAVRDLVYADTSETKFSAPWPVLKDKKLGVDVHFGAVGHQVVAWTLAFATFELVSNYCNDRDREWARAATQNFEPTTSDKTNDNYLSGLELITALPPPLTRDLMLHSVSVQWKESIKADNEKKSQYCANGKSEGNPCTLAFIIGPSGISSHQQFTSDVSPHISENDGWGWDDDIKGYGWTSKLGWVAKKAGAKFVITFKKLHRPVRMFTLISMKSYGEKWKGSSARFTAAVSDQSVGNRTVHTTMTVAGIHDSATSISYTNIMELEEGGAGIGDNLKLEIELVGGTTFKIQGMMFCSF